MPNSVSSAPTRSVNVNESSKPDSKSDSPAAGLMGLPKTSGMIQMILSRYSIKSVLPHRVGEQHRRQPAVTRRSKVHVVALGDSRINPVAYRSFAAHPFARVPKRAAVLTA